MFSEYRMLRYGDKLIYSTIIVQDDGQEASMYINDKRIAIQYLLKGETIMQDDGVVLVFDKSMLSIKQRLTIHSVKTDFPKVSKSKLRKALQAQNIQNEISNSGQNFQIEKDQLVLAGILFVLGLVGFYFTEDKSIKMQIVPGILMAAAYFTILSPLDKLIGENVLPDRLSMKLWVVLSLLLMIFTRQFLIPMLTSI